ncbi:MAG: hypothetical protein ACR2PL_26775, partial [Dehalococcoidia bacterium]
MRIRSLHLLIAGLLLASLAGGLLAQQQVNAEGDTGGITIVKHIVDSSGTELTNADRSGYSFTVVGPGVNAGYITSASGAITVLGLPAGSYRVTETGDSAAQFQRMSALGNTLANGDGVSVMAGQSAIVDVYNMAGGQSAPATPQATESPAPSPAPTPPPSPSPSPSPSPTPSPSPSPSTSPIIVLPTPAASAPVVSGPSSLSIVAGLPLRISMAYTIQLLPGWNDIAYLGPTLPVADALQSLAGHYIQVLSYDATRQRWLQYDPNQPDQSDFQYLQTGEAYAIVATDAVPLVQANAVQDIVSTPPALHAGFNNIAYRGPTAPIATALGDLAQRVVRIYSFDPVNQRWQVFGVSDSASSEFTTLTHDQAYLIDAVDVDQRAPGETSLDRNGCRVSPLAGVYNFARFAVLTGGARSAGVVTAIGAASDGNM